MSQDKKTTLIEDYICLTFPYQMRDAMEAQQETVERVREITDGKDVEAITRQENILNMMMTDDFRDAALEALRKEMEIFTEEELELACLYEQTMRKMTEVSLKVATAFDKLLEKGLQKERGEVE